MKKKMPKSLRKFIRRKKAEIRRKFLDPEKAQQEIKKFLETLKTKKNNLCSNKS